MAYGFDSFDSNGISNNYGIVPISVLGMITLSSGQTGSWSFNPPSGYGIGYEFTSTENNYETTSRFVTDSGGSLTVSSSGSGKIIPNGPGFLTVYIRRL